VFDNNKRYIFSNWTDEDFEGEWAGEKTLIKSGETKELTMALAYHFTKHLVNREMSRDNISHIQDVQEQRTPYEVKTIAEIVAGTDSPALASLKEQIKAEIEEETSKKVKKEKKEKVGKVVKSKEFEDIISKFTKKKKPKF
jgi:enoyl-CoA hydratase/carnithine racemase